MQKEEQIERAINDLGTHLAAVSRELAAERAQRLKDAKRGLSILNLHVPLAIVLGLFGAFAAIVITASTYVHTVSSHMDNEKIHVNEKKALQLDGVAYAGEVKATLESKASDLEAAIRRNGRAIKGGVKCTPTGNRKSPGEVSCTFVDPESLPLR